MVHLIEALSLHLRKQTGSPFNVLTCKILAIAIKQKRQQNRTLLRSFVIDLYSGKLPGISSPCQDLHWTSAGFRAVIVRSPLLELQIQSSVQNFSVVL